MAFDHISMATRWDPILTLQDCFQTFSQEYVDSVITVTMVTLLHHIENNWPVTTHGIVPVARPTNQLLGYYRFRNYLTH